MAKVEMTQEIADQLKGLLPISTATRERFTPSVYKSESFPKQFAPVFIVRPMTKAEKLEFLTGHEDDREGRENIVFSCIDDVENMWDAIARQKVKFCREIYDALRFDVVTEVQSEILKLSGLLSADKLGLK